LHSIKETDFVYEEHIHFTEESLRQVKTTAKNSWWLVRTPTWRSADLGRGKSAAPLQSVA